MVVGLSLYYVTEKSVVKSFNLFSTLDSMAKKDSTSKKAVKNSSSSVKEEKKLDSKVDSTSKTTKKVTAKKTSKISKKQDIKNQSIVSNLEKKNTIEEEVSK